MRKVVFIFPYLLVGLVLGCTAINDDILSFFFDGVRPDSARMAQNGTKQKNGAQVKKVLIVHSPYQDGDCSSCHDIEEFQHANQLSDEIPTLCYECHDEDKFTKEVVHSPVEDGECMECHHPHESTQPALLHKPVIATCFGCHEKVEIDEAHEEVEGSSNDSSNGAGRVICIQCHNPHSSDEEFLIRHDKDK